jgi:hypothetical protein
MSLFVYIIACSDTINKHFGNASYSKFPYSYSREFQTLPPMTLRQQAAIDVTACPHIRPIAIWC